MKIRLRPGIRLLATMAVMALALPGLAGQASAATLSKDVLTSAPASQKISTAHQLSLGVTEKGGNHNIDFWKVTLVGGYRLSFSFTPGSSGGGYSVDLYAPSVKDPTFYQTGALVTQLGPGPGSDFTLQAPYSGTFILAICQAAGGYSPPGNCAGADPPNGGTTPPYIQNPMAAYSFSAAIEKDGITSTEAKGEQGSGVFRECPHLS
jgi:hypothetical protein